MTRLKAAATSMMSKDLLTALHRLAILRGYKSPSDIIHLMTERARSGTAKAK